MQSKMRIYSSMLGMLGLLFSSSLTAQIDNAGSELFRPFEAKLAHSNKMKANPILPKVEEDPNKEMDYVVPTRLLELTYPAPTIRPLGMPTEKAPRNYNFYTKLGFGYPISPLAEISYNSSASDKIRYGLHYRHHSGRGNMTHQRYFENNAGINATYFTDKFAVGGALGFNLDGVRFYGLQEILGDTTTIDIDSITQRFTEVNGKVEIFNSGRTKSDFNYHGDVAFHILSDRYQASEFDITPEVGIEKWFGKTSAIEVDFGLNLNSFKDTVVNDTVSGSRFMTYLRPAFIINSGAFQGRFGGDVGLSEGSFYAYPDVELGVKIWDGQLGFFAGTKGEIRRNNFRSLTNYNPFIVSAMNMRHTKYWDFYGGIRGNLRGIGYDARIAYALTKDLPLFVNDAASDYARFAVVYDTVNIFSITGAIDFDIIPNLHLRAALGFYNYAAGTNKAYHLPTFESNIDAVYSMKFGKAKDAFKNRLDLEASFFVNSGVPYFDEVTLTEETLNGLFDFNLGATYHFSSQAAAFVDINNVLNNQNQRWRYYKQIGFNVMAGVIFKLDTDRRRR